MHHLNGKYIVITGVGGDLGFGLLKFFYKKKCKIIGFARSRSPRLNKLVTKKNIQIFYGDLSDEDFVKNSLIKNGIFKKGIDHLINCAGTSSFEKINQISMVKWKKIVDDNLTSTFIVTKTCLSLFSKKGDRSIINISSIAGQKYSKVAGVHYTACKAAIIGFTKQLAIELSSKKIRVNYIAPGQIDSRMLSHAIKINKINKKNLINSIPLKRLATVDDVVNACEFLLSDKSSYITATSIDVNGGAI